MLKPAKWHYPRNAKEIALVEALQDARGALTDIYLEFKLDKYHNNRVEWRTGFLQDCLSDIAQLLELKTNHPGDEAEE